MVKNSDDYPTQKLGEKAHMLYKGGRARVHQCFHIFYKNDDKSFSGSLSTFA